MANTRRLKVFLCHASQDKPTARELYKRLAAEKWIDPWLDEENLLPGQDFDLEIYKAARDSDSIIICLSKVSVAKEGYVNKEIRRALDAADEKLEGAIYIIPLRLDDCTPSFERLKQLHYADYFTPNAHEKLIKSLRLRADVLKIETSESVAPPISLPTPVVPKQDIDLDLYRFIQIPATDEVPYSFCIGKYPVTNAQYGRFLKAPDFANPIYWLEFTKFDEKCDRIGNWGKQGFDWLQEELKKTKSKALMPQYWGNLNFGYPNPHNPVVGVSWHEANAYCEWLFQNWNALPESKANLFLKPQEIRLPLESEWITSAGGENPEYRYPWDEAGKETMSLKEIVHHANVRISGIKHTTPVNNYTLGKSPHGVMDMAGNVWEWLANFDDISHDTLSLHGASWESSEDHARVSMRIDYVPSFRYSTVGFRLVASIPHG